MDDWLRCRNCGGAHGSSESCNEYMGRQLYSNYRDPSIGVTPPPESAWTPPEAGEIPPYKED